MKGTGQVLTFNGTVAPALNVYGQTVVQTGLAPGGLDALLFLGGQLEFNRSIDANATREFCLSRATKTAMPTLLDDDVVVKDATQTSFVTSGYLSQDLVKNILLPPNSIILVESNFYLQFKTTGQVTVMNMNAFLYFEKVVLTESEKNSILSARLNNLLT